MKATLLYLLQVIIASGLLYGYYHFFLRNNRFHQYNRFYLLLSSVVQHPYDRLFAVPVGFAIAWLGYALWSERREPAGQPLPGSATPQLRPTGAE